MTLTIVTGILYGVQVDIIKATTDDEAVSAATIADAGVSTAVADDEQIGTVTIDDDP